MTLRVLIAVTHLLGAGHLTRAAAIGRALVARGHDVTLVSGGTASGLIDVSGLQLVQLDALRARVGDFSTLRDESGAPIGPDHLARRREALLGAYRKTQPDVVVTELFPFGRRGLRDEFLALLEAAAADEPRPAILASVRDILVAPGRADRIEATHDLVRRFYDRILVHGDEAVTPLEASWPLASDLQSRLVYTGYVGPAAINGRRAPVNPSTETVLVSGGSSAASLPLYRAALEAARLWPGNGWRVLVGHGVDSNTFGALQATAPSHVTVERARNDFTALLAGAHVFVGQAGYNTVMDLVATRTRAVLVPFEQGHETEQRMRVESLARRGEAIMLPESELGPASLAEAVRKAIALQRPAFRSIRLDGADRAALAIESAAGRHRGEGPPAR